MSAEAFSTDFLASVKQTLINEVKKELLTEITISLSQQRLNVSEAAKYIGVSEDTIYTLCREKKIPHYRGGSGLSKKPKIFFRVESLDKWMSVQEIENCPGWRE